MQDIKNALDYGIPGEKLVAGLPFYATQGKGAAGTKAYRSLVEEHLITHPDTDEIIFKESKYTFNGQTTIHKKVLHAKELKLRGIMSWDLATDCAYTNQWSLQRTVVESLLPPSSR
ncbi:chitinase [gut metagenome]|uniref:Chitinase n=1 Tax=gut metagenome TaxID=749906 RepID=J9D4R7_9ZZZZ